MFTCFVGTGPQYDAINSVGKQVASTKPSASVPKFGKEKRVTPSVDGLLHFIFISHHFLCFFYRLCVQTQRSHLVPSTYHLLNLVQELGSDRWCRERKVRLRSVLGVQQGAKNQIRG